MTRVTLLVNMGKWKAGYGIEVEDGLANLWVKQGKAKIGGPTQALKKGSLENYNNCQPLTPAEISAKAAATKSVLPPPVADAAETLKAPTHANTNTTNT